ncbi:MAG: radical SAM protein, partial [Alphaproteobacteria bacterium]|nr:radical SAM protein [Alphaproteobacteria bacterium]
MPSNILLIEPNYPNKYPPLGLMKIAQYHGPDGKNDNVRFIKGEDRRVLDMHWDRVYVTTLFSFEFARIAKAIDFAVEVVNGSTDRIFVGGIAASLMHGKFSSESRWSGIRFIKGLLNKSPAASLQLDSFSGELYADDIAGLPIEDHIPDYSILDQIDYEYPVIDAYFGYASRGCVRKCKFCGVPKLEGMQRDVESLSDIINGIERQYLSLIHI